MLSKTQVLLLAPLLLCADCGKDDHEGYPGTPSLADECGVVEGISVVDINGQSVFPPDPLDWRTVDDWCYEVDMLFYDVPGLTWAEELDSSFFLGYPNPCETQFALHLDNDAFTIVDVRVVDDEFNLLYAIDSIAGNTVVISADTLGVTSDELVRVYYRILNSDGTAHRGHGDMLILP